MLYPNSATQNKDEIKKIFQSRLNRSSNDNQDNVGEFHNNLDSNSASEDHVQNENEKVILFRNSNFTFKGCLTSFFLILIILILFVYFLTTQIPSFKSQVDNFLNNQILPQLNQKLSGLKIPVLNGSSNSTTSLQSQQDHFAQSFLGKITNLNRSQNQTETISFTQDEINAWLMKQNFVLSDQKINAYTIIDPNNLKLNLTSGNILPQVSIFIGTNNENKFRVNGGSIAGTSLSIADFRDKLSTLPLGIGNYNFEKIDEYFNQLLFNNNWKINTVILKNQEVEMVVLK